MFHSYTPESDKEEVYIAWKVSKYRVFSGPHFPVFGMYTGKCRPEKTPYLDTFHVMIEMEHWAKLV